MKVLARYDLFDIFGKERGFAHEFITDNGMIYRVDIHYPAGPYFQSGISVNFLGEAQ